MSSDDIKHQATEIVGVVVSATTESSEPAVSQTTIPPGPNEEPASGTSHAQLDCIPAGTAQVIGGYRLLGVLGSGGMGVVYKALDQKISRTVALKQLHVGRDPGFDAMIRFRGEAEVLGSLQHPNIVQVYDFGMHKEAPYLVMEFIEGGSMADKLRGQPQYPRKAAEMIELLARAIHVAHQKGIVHRDLKPGNVLLTREGTPKITDFGLAKRLHTDSGVTKTSGVLGSPSYMAPEQAAGRKDVGIAADVYALGAILYEMMTGRPPFIGATLQETLEQVQLADPAPPSRLVPKLPRDLQSICLMCLHKSPSRRYPTAMGLAEDLRSWLEGLPVRARPMHSLERFVRGVARRPQRAALAVAGILVIVLLAFLFVGQVNAQKEKAQKSMDDFERMINLTLDKDVHTPAGLDRLKLTFDDQALAFTNARNAGTAEPREGMLLAIAYSRLAGLRGEQGELDRAIESLRSAVKLLESLDGNPLASLSGTGNQVDKDRDQLERARIYQQLGFLQSTTQATSKESIETSKKALELLGRTSPGFANDSEFMRVKVDVLHDLAVATWRQLSDNDKGWRGNMLAADGNFALAEALLRKVIEKTENDLDAAQKARDAQIDPQGRQTQETQVLKFSRDLDRDYRNLARTLAAVGNNYVDMNRRHEADAAYWESHQIREMLYRKSRNDFESKKQLARSWNNFGRYQTRLRMFGTALYFYDRSLEIRSEMNARRPDNKEYVLELAGVLNRIAEVQLFDANRESDAELTPQEKAESKRTLEAAMATLARCEMLLNELFDRLKEDDRKDEETGNRAHSCLGECHALKARADLIRNDLEPESGGLEEALIAARAAGDSFQKLVDRDRELTEDELYQQAAAASLGAEVRARRSKEPVRSDGGHATAEASLKKSITRCFRRLAPEEIQRDRAFRDIRDKPFFQELLKEQGAVYRNQITSEGDQGVPAEAAPSTGARKSGGEGSDGAAAARE